MQLGGNRCQKRRVLILPGGIQQSCVLDQFDDLHRYVTFFHDHPVRKKGYAAASGYPTSPGAGQLLTVAHSGQVRRSYRRLGVLLSNALELSCTANLLYEEADLVRRGGGINHEDDWSTGVGDGD